MLFEELLPLKEAMVQFVANADVRRVDDCNARVVSHSLKIAQELWIAEHLGVNETAVRTGIQLTAWVASKNAMTLHWFRVGRPHQGEREYERSASNKGHRRQ
jgi:hypothetical protein